MRAVVFPEIGGFYSAIFYKSGVVKVSDFMSLLCNFLKSVLNIFVRPQGLLGVNKLSKTIAQFFNSEPLFRG